MLSFDNYDVLDFNKKFGIPMAIEPSMLSSSLKAYRIKCLQEELDEFIAADNLLDQADALIDLVYFVHGTALMMGLSWEELWYEVHHCNMQKERTENISQTKRGHALDLIKPPGWVGPDHSKFLGEGPWPIFDGQ